MKLKDWLDSIGWTPGRLAAEMGVPRCKPYRWIKGAEPRAGEIAKIEDLSDGKVSAIDLAFDKGEEKIAFTSTPSKPTRWRKSRVKKDEA